MTARIQAVSCPDCPWAGDTPVFEGGWWYCHHCSRTHTLEAVAS